MPVDPPRRDREETPGPVVLRANVDCPACKTTFAGLWTDPSISIQDMVDAPVAEQRCPYCGHTEEVEYPGWMNWGNA